MAPYFYLSYARDDRSPLIKRFHDDLVDTLRVRLGNRTESVTGFYEETSYEADGDWTMDSVTALQTSPVLFALLSPAYFRDEHAAREWQIFEMRQRLYIRQLLFRQTTSVHMLGQSAITPVTWIRAEGRIPLVIAQTKTFEEFQTADQKQPVLAMLKSLRTCGSTYAGFVYLLADRVIELFRTMPLPPLPVIPPRKEVYNPFSLTVPIAADRLEEQPADRKLFMIDGKLVRTLADQIDETVERINSTGVQFLGTAHHAKQSFTKERIGKRMSKYTLWVIDDTPYMLKLIEDICVLSGLFEVTPYDDPETLLSHLSLRAFNNQEMPDLFIIDLKLEDKTIQGLELISELSSRRDFRSAIVAISGYARVDELSDAVAAGAEWGITKPFSDDFVDQLQRVAEIGRNKRLYTFNESIPDDLRKQRPVFLSYSVKDSKPGNLIRRNLEAREMNVWYAPDVLVPGDEWRERIREGLHQARVLVPLISKNYVDSSICKAELMTVLRRIKSEFPRPPLLIPVLYDYSAQLAAQDELIKQCLRYQYIEISAATLADGLTFLYWTIKKFLERDASGDPTSA